MCGIAGRFNYDPLQPVDRDVLVAMTDAVAHRGPDAAGYYHGAGHRPRPPAAEHHRSRRPAISRSRTKTARCGSIFNGEIYNFADVRAELIAHGHRFRTDSDTEVIVHGYEEWGERCVEQLPRHVRVRDLGRAARAGCCSPAIALGVKPLYYAELPGTRRRLRLRDQVAARGSRRAARVAPRGDRRVSRRCSTSRRRTRSTAASHKLPPGHVLVAEQRRASAVSRYWDLQFTGDGDAGARGRLPRGARRAARAKSVALRLISDVPLGAFLSGGIDSTAVVAYMVETSHAAAGDHRGRLRRRGLRRARARASASRGISAASSTRAPSRPTSSTLLPKLAWHFDEPFADSSAVPDLLRLEGGARAGHGGAVGRWRRRAVGRLRASPRRARGTAARADRSARRGALAGWLGHALPLSVKGARSLRHLGACARTRPTR